MFESIQAAPPDPILGISEAFLKDPRDGKINLSVGVFKDEAGATPVLASVKAAEHRLLEQEKNKLYKPIPGDPAYGKAVRELLFGGGDSKVSDGRAVTAHTPGGTGALRLAADFLVGKAGVKKIWVSDPTWENHRAIFSAVGLEVSGYRYFDAETNGLDFDGMLAALGQVGAGEAVLLHACCHNPSGVDPTAAQWEKIADVLESRGAIPLVDFAYQGFGSGIQEDATGLRILAKKHDEMLICSSFSKNFGLYNERTGALTITTQTAAEGEAVMSQLKVCARVNYSNPPAHGGAIVTTIWGDDELRGSWERELAEMCKRIANMREAFVLGLKKAGADRDFSFITSQKGMFSFSGLSREQVERLKAEHAVYIVGSGRINVAGMSSSTMDKLCQAIVSVL